MRVTLFADGTYASNSYLLQDDAGGGAVLVDPSLPPSFLRRKMPELPPITLLLLTHGHFDHMLALREWHAEGIPLAIHTADAPALTDATRSCFLQFMGEDITFPPPERLLKEGDTVAVGKEWLTVLSTPGHTPGSAVFLASGVMLSGDTLFAGGGYGRYDLPYGDGQALFASLDRLLRLEGEYTVYAGHGAATTLSAEKKMFHSF